MKGLNIIKKREAHYVEFTLTKYNNSQLRLESWVELDSSADEISERDILNSISKYEIQLNKEDNLTVTTYVNSLFRIPHQECLYFMLIPSKDNMFSVILSILTAYEKDTSENKTVTVDKILNPTLFPVLSKLLFKNFR